MERRLNSRTLIDTGHDCFNPAALRLALPTWARRNNHSPMLKYKAKLQENQSCNNPILIRIEDRAGHGSGTPKDKIINQISEIYGYALNTINN